MPTQRRQRFIHGQLAWMLVTLVLLAALGAVSLETFFLISLLGFLIITELTAPLNVTPTWRKRLRWIIFAGLAVFGMFILRFLQRTLLPEVF
ncbi:hypothetical protein [Halalkalicoccus salilacus]|uniref:hypothetical protein n=1 Tax=Halalkalicoccus TaxID=332246 RepID=UPI00360E22FE